MNIMTEKIHKTQLGDIHYWTNIIDENAVTLVFLPGLTADHRLFEKQIEYFENKFNVFVIKYKDGYGNANLKILRTQKQ